MSAVRFGIIGCGVIGPSHAEAIADLPDAELVAVADQVGDRARRLAETYGASAYTDVQDMLHREDLDVVTVTTPSGMHAEHACQVMRSGRHVIIEKPMEITVQKLDEIERVQRETGVKLTVVSQHRWDEATRRVHDLVEEGALGRLVVGAASVLWWRSQSYYDSGAWRGTRDLDGGGVLMNQGIHSIDILTWLMGRVRSVCAYTGTLAHRMETEDVAAAALRFDNGALGSITATTAAYPGVSTRIEIMGDAGSAVIEDDRLSFLHLRLDEENAVGDYGVSRGEEKTVSDSGNPAQNAADLPFRGHANQFADMIRAIRDDAKPLIDARAARHPVEVILAIYESARMHQEVALS